MHKTITRIFLITVIFVLVALGIYFTFNSVNIDAGTLPLSMNSNTVELNLQKKGLTSLPSEIGKLTNLTVFNVSNNNLTGALPAEIGKFTKLVTLDLTNNPMTQEKINMLKEKLPNTTILF